MGDHDAEDVAAMEFLQSLSGEPWTSMCGRVSASRGRISEADYGVFVEPAYTFWNVDYRADSGHSWSVYLRDGPDGVDAAAVMSKIRQFMEYQGAEP